ncbi:MAG: hypothetical protein QHH09_01255 [Microgenomates group bacterium]|nr:hypothetical protein [Microgenomates group bacterium]
MKNYLIAVLIGLLAIGGVLVIKNKPKENKSTTQKTNQTSTASPSLQPTSTVNYTSIFQEGKNVCEIFKKEKIEEFLGKTFHSVKNGENKTSKYTEYYCEYYQEPPGFTYEGNVPIPSKRIPISFVKGDITGIRESYKLSGYSIKQNSEIPFPHQLVYNQKNQLQRLEIFLADDLDLIVNTFQSNLTSDEALNFVKKFALYVKDLSENKTSSQSQQPNPTTNSQTSGTVPLPQDEDVLRNFVNLIEEGKPDDAAKMMKISDQSPPQANSELQAWAVQFSNITSFKLLKMEKTNENQWTDIKHIYKVVLDVWMNPDSASAPIPYYGWENGENTRFITLEKVGNLWKIAEIATGP